MKPVKWKVSCPQCDYETLMWSNPKDMECPVCSGEQTPLEQLREVSGVSTQKAQDLVASGFTSVHDLRKTDEETLAETPGIGQALAARIKADVGYTGDLAGKVSLSDVGMEEPTPVVELDRVWYADGSVIEHSNS